MPEHASAAAVGGTFLEQTVDKFTFRVATDRLYTPEGFWVLAMQAGTSGRVRVGLTDFMQQRSGDMAFVSVKAPGTRLAAGDDLAEIETVKVTVSLPAPLGGTVVQVNEALELTPEVVNQDPYGRGWLAVIEVAKWEDERARLLDPAAYLAHMQREVEKELAKS
jgi:glycine cleavage system H protein